MATKEEIAKAAQGIGILAQGGATPHERYRELAAWRLTLDEVNANWKNRQKAPSATSVATQAG